MSRVTTHVLDAALGRPAPDVAVELLDGEDRLARGRTDDDGRVRQLGPEALPAGTYRLRFMTGEYFTRTSRATFFPEVTVTFALPNDGHVHVPLLLSPFAYSTYRGS